jgi:transaldolase/glucose-6-phosphate isomerase
MAYEAESLQLGDYQGAVKTALDKMVDDQIMLRIWEHDYTVWEPKPDEITNRLGWLHIAQKTLDDADRLEAGAKAAYDAGYRQVLWLGMGGSSLAPDVFSRIFPADRMRLDVLDSTVPGVVLAEAARIDPAKTLFVVATKSGKTAETLSFFRYFYNQTAAAVGADGAGDHFMAVTDAGTHLDDLASKYGFRETFRNDPNIGGRYSALSYFGMLAATLIGIDIKRYLNDAVEMMHTCQAPRNPAATLGTIMGVLAGKGRDKVTLIASPPIAPFGDWVEQLIAESTGKSGKGILPVVGEPIGAPEVYGDDRLFVYIKLADDTTHDAAVDALAAAGQPVVRYTINDPYKLGGQTFLWEMAVAVAGYHLGIQPFNQPNVESAKVRAREMMDAYRKEGTLPELDPTLTDGDITVYGEASADSAPGALRAFVDQGGAYIALQAYVEPAEATTAALRSLQAALRDATKLAVTVGYGPRFLHSTGQLHKGDAGNGLFVQFLADDPTDAPIPDEAGSDASSITFGVLKEAQALGDRRALLDAGRRVIRFDLDGDVTGGLGRLEAGLG